MKTVKDDNKITVYPNPSVDYVAWYYTFPKGENASHLAIFDMLGNKVYSVGLKGEMGQYIWDVRMVTYGIYLYQLTTNAGVKYFGKVSVKK